MDFLPTPTASRHMGYAICAHAEHHALNVFEQESHECCHQHAISFLVSHSLALTYRFAWLWTDVHMCTYIPESTVHRWVDCPSSSFISVCFLSTNIFLAWYIYCVTGNFHTCKNLQKSCFHFRTYCISCDKNYVG